MKRQYGTIRRHVKKYGLLYILYGLDLFFLLLTAACAFVSFMNFRFDANSPAGVVTLIGAIGYGLCLLWCIACTWLEISDLREVKV